MAESTTNQDVITLSEEEQEVLKTVMYMDAFGHPLKPSEVHQFTARSMSPLNVVPCINYLVNNGLLSQTGNFISVDENANAVELRKAAASESDKSMSAAKTMARFANRFPFVRGVALVGGSVVGLPSEQWPLSILLITKRGKLWMTRFLLNLTRSFLPAYKQRAFNVEFMFDENALEIARKDRHTALVVAGMLPLYGEKAMTAFIEQNQWSRTILPNFKPIASTKGLAGSTSTLKSFFEAILGIGLFAFCGKIARKAYKRQLEENTDGTDIDSTDHGRVLLPVHSGKGTRIETAYKQRLLQFQEQHNTDLNISEIDG